MWVRLECKLEFYQHFYSVLITPSALCVVTYAGYLFLSIYGEAVGTLYMYDVMYFDIWECAWVVESRINFVI
jgi:hypothetical protein